MSGLEILMSPGLSKLTEEATAFHREWFGVAPAVRVAAPGRVNLIGEHVDYNDGYVLPMAIDRHTVIAAAPTASREVRLSSVLRPGLVTIPLDGELVRGEPAWSNYVRGVLAGFREAGGALPGFTAVVHSDVPLGGGLSSSASLEVAVCLVLEALTGRSLEPVQRIRLCQRAEHAYAGVPCGIMDQFVVATATRDHALLLDCRSLEARPVPLDGGEVALLVTHCGVAHELGKGEYAKRRADCHRAAEVLGVPSLRTATLEDLASHRDRLSDTEYRRARHVITEIGRTLAFATALEAGRWEEAGRRMYESHASLRDDYEVSCDELNVLVEIAQGLGEGRGVYGARLTGGGFGGCTVTLVRADAAADAAEHLRSLYLARTRIAPQGFASRPVSGARILPP